MSRKIDLSRKVTKEERIIKTRNTSSTYISQIKYGFQENNEREENNENLEEQEENEEEENEDHDEEEEENENVEEQDENTTEESDTLSKIYNLKQQLEKITVNIKKVKKTAKKAKFIKPLIIGILALLILIMIVIIGAFIIGLQMNNYKYLSRQCKTITVINTDCDNSGNCSNKYDGDVSFEDYIAGVVAADSGVNSNNLEYYKTIAIAARTYFYNNFTSDCIVEGNSTYQTYIDVEDSNYKETIKTAVEETKGLAMVIEEQFITGDYSTACVVDADNENYHIRYGSVTLEETGIQTIPKQWELTSVYNRTLEKYYSSIDKNNTDKYTKECPENTNDYGMSTIGALYLITKDNKTHKEVLKYYYGEAFELKNTNIPNSEIVNGFINPVNNATCSSSFGCRKHPISNDYESHMGIDLGAEAGEPIYATKDGKILSVTKNVPGYSDVYSYGNSILIEHDDGTRTRYAHMLYGSIPDDIKVGTKVQQGDIIGQVGSTGVSNGNHLHYEIYFNGELQDPIDYLDLSNIGNNKQCENNSNIDLSSCGL